MKFIQCESLLLGTATGSRPVVLFAQSDPMDPPSSSKHDATHPVRTAHPHRHAGLDRQRSDVGQMMKDKMFLRKAAEGGMAEVQLGQLAAQKASSDDVKDFGQKMVDDHTMLNNEMAPIADSMGVRAAEEHQQRRPGRVRQAQRPSGNDFDTEYLSFMVKDHQQDLREFRTEAASAADPTLQRLRLIKARRSSTSTWRWWISWPGKKAFRYPTHGGNDLLRLRA